MKLSRHKFIRRLLNYYRTHFHIETPFIVLIDGTFAFEALKWKIQIDEQLKAYLETNEIVCSTTLCAIKETELLGGIGFGAMLILKQYEIIKCDHYPSIAAEKCIQHVLTKDKTKSYFLASQSLSLREYCHEQRPDLPTMLITHNAINLERPSTNSRDIVEKLKNKRTNLNSKLMLTIFLLSIDSLKLWIPVLSLFGASPTFFSFWVLLRSFTSIFSSLKTYRRYDDYLYSIYQRFVLFFFQNWTSVKVFVHGDYDEVFKRKENILYISNHQSSVDWIIADMLAIRQGSLGHIRYILKNDLKWIPLYGFYFQQHGCVYVHRNDKKDIKRVESGMRQIEYNGLPVWLVIFPEGTRYNPTNGLNIIQRSQQFAIEKGLHPLDYVLYPRSGATIAALRALRNKLDAVYDITLMYYKTYNNHRLSHLTAPSMFGYVQGGVDELHIDIRRISISEIPCDTDEQISHWLYQRFYLKDKLLQRFYEFNQNRTSDSFLFRSDNDDVPMELILPLRETISSLLLFTLTTIPLLCSSRGRSIYLKFCLFITPISLLWMHLFPPSRVQLMET